MSKSLYDCACGARRVAARGVTELGVTLTVYQCPKCGRTVGKAGRKSAAVQEAVAKLGVDGHSVNFPFPDARNFKRSAELAAAVIGVLNIKQPFMLHFREYVAGHGKCSARVEADCLSKNCVSCIMRGGNVLAYHSARMQPKNGIVRYPVPVGCNPAIIRRETAIFANTASAIAISPWEFWANLKCCEQHIRHRQIPCSQVAADYLQAILDCREHVTKRISADKYAKLLGVLGNIVNGSYDESTTLDYPACVPAEYLLLYRIGMDDVGASIAETEDIIRQHLARNNASCGDRLVYLGPLTAASMN
jgi:hypothetical protein